MIEPYFSSVFYPSLTFPEKQTRLHEGRKIVDITYSNTAESGFFKWLSMHYKAPFIFIECKNYSTDPNNPELDQLSGRFSSLRGQFGLLVCRKIDDKQKFEKRCKDTALDGRGFIIGLDDDDLEVIADAELSNEKKQLFSFLKEKFDKLVM